MSLRSVLSLSFHPRRGYVTSARNLVCQFLREFVHDDDEFDRCLITAHELIENIVKYSTGTEVRIEASATQVEQAVVVRIQAENEAIPERVSEVRERLRALIEAPDPHAHYDSLILETATRTDGSGLGLARIRAEADMSISYEIVSQRVSIVAETTLRHGRDRGPECV